MTIRKTIKKILIDEGLTLTELVNKLNTEHNRNDSVQNLSNKLRRGTLKYDDALEIASVLNYNIEWVKNEN